MSTHPHRPILPGIVLAAVLVAECGGGPATSTDTPLDAAAFAGLPAPSGAAAAGFVGATATGGRAGRHPDRSRAGRGLPVRRRRTRPVVHGTVDGDGFTLTAADGTVLTATSDAAGLSGTVGDTPFTLAPTTGNAGLYREQIAVDGASFVSGWVVANDGAIHGTSSDEEGRAVAGAVIGPGDGADDPKPFTPATSAPVPTGFFQNVRCGALLVQDGFNRRQAATAAAAGDAAGVQDAELDGAVINAKLSRAGCV